MRKRTSILADAELLLDARYLAKREGKTFTALVQDALREYIDKHCQFRGLPDWVGMVSSEGESLTVEEMDEILRRDIHPIYGWSVSATQEREQAAARDRHDEAKAR